MYSAKGPRAGHGTQASGPGKYRNSVPAVDYTSKLTVVDWENYIKKQQDQTNLQTIQEESKNVTNDNMIIEALNQNLGHSYPDAKKFKIDLSAIEAPKTQADLKKQPNKPRKKTRSLSTTAAKPPGNRRLSSREDPLVDDMDVDLI